MPALTPETLVQHLELLTQTGGADNRLVVASRDYYMIFHGKRGAPELVGEAVSNFYLPRPAELTPGRLGQLTARGYRERPNRNNLYRSLRVQDAAELRSYADEVMEVFARAYGVDAGEAAEFELQLGEPEPLKNPELIRLMRLLSEKRDWDTRRALYSALLGATMLVPIDPDAGVPDEPMEVDRLGKFPVIAAFTDMTSLRLWQPRGAHCRSLAIADLVPRAVTRRVGSLLINPRGMVGGELYLNELESLDGALKRRASSV